MPSCCRTLTGIRHTPGESPAGWFRACGSGGGRPEPAPFDAPSAVQNQLDRFGIDAVLLNQDARRERRRYVVVEHGNGCLEHDWPAVELAGHEMDGCATDANAVRQRLRLRIHTGEGGEQGRM